MIWNVAWARTKGDRHWWIEGRNGERHHLWFAIKTSTRTSNPARILTVIIGPLSFKVGWNAKEPQP